MKWFCSKCYNWLRWIIFRHLASEAQERKKVWTKLILWYKDCHLKHLKRISMSEYNVTFLVLVNPKSGGQDGPHLLEKFTDIFREVSEGFKFFLKKIMENSISPTCAMMAATRKISSVTRTILVLTWFCHLNMCLWIIPPYTWKKLQCLKLIFRPFGKKIESENDPCWPPPPSLLWNFP